jgi:hypothetical protein
VTNEHKTARAAEELIALIEQLADKQAALQGAVGAKLETMRRCDVDGMLAGSLREANLTAEVAALDQRRQEVVSRLGAALALPKGANGKSVTLRTLMPKLEPAAAKRLAKAAERLRGEMLKLAEANRVVDLVCREMMVHFKALFTAMVQSESDPSTYSRGGEVGPVAGARVLDAVG